VDEPQPTPSKRREILKGLPWPLLFLLAAYVAEAWFASVSRAWMPANWDNSSAPLAIEFGLAALGTAALAARWWTRSRRRVYGVIFGVLGPLALALVAGLFVVWALSQAHR